MLEGAGGASSTGGDVLQHCFHARAMWFLTDGGRCTIHCCFPVLSQTGVGMLQKLPSFNKSSVPLKSRDAGARGREGLYHGCTAGWAHPSTSSHQGRAERAGRRAVVDRGQGIEPPESSGHRLRLQKLTSDLPIIRQVIVAHLLFLVSTIVLLAHCPPMVTHLNENICISHVSISKDFSFPIW